MAVVVVAVVVVAVVVDVVVVVVTAVAHSASVRCRGTHRARTRGRAHQKMGQRTPPLVVGTPQARRTMGRTAVPSGTAARLSAAEPGTPMSSAPRWCRQAADCGWKMIMGGSSTPGAFLKADPHTQQPLDGRVVPDTRPGTASEGTFWQLRAVQRNGLRSRERRFESCRGHCSGA